MKKTLMKSLLLAAFALGTQNVSAQKVAVDDAVATNIRPNMSIGQKFYYEAIVYQITDADGSKYNVNAIGFYDGEIKETVNIIGSGSANGANFVVDEIEALNSALALSGTNFVAGDASKLAEIELIDFIADGGFEGTIGEEAFGNLDGLTNINVNVTTLITADDSSFDNIDYDNIVLTLPQSTNGTLAGKFISSDGWRWFAAKNVKIKDYPNGFGDVNLDGYTNVVDVADLRDAKAGGYLDEMNPQSLDINGDGYVNVLDCGALRKWISQDFE